MLRACRRLLRSGGRISFFTIFIAPGLSPAAHRRAARAGPPVAGGPDASSLLVRTGFDRVEQVDVTADYLQTTIGWLRAWERYAEELRRPDPAEFDQRMKDRRRAVAAIEDGLLRRALFVATRP